MFIRIKIDAQNRHQSIAIQVYNSKNYIVIHTYTQIVTYYIDINNIHIPHYPVDTHIILNIELKLCNK